MLNAHIHKLFHRVQPQCQSPLTPDPRLFIALSESFAALHGTSSLDTSLATTFEIIHQQSTGYQDWLSTQRWSQAWLSVIGNLGDWRGDRQLDTKNVLRAFLTSLSACVGYSLKASQNRKAVSCHDHLMQCRIDVVHRRLKACFGPAFLMYDLRYRSSAHDEIS